MIHHSQKAPCYYSNPPIRPCRSGVSSALCIICSEVYIDQTGRTLQDGCWLWAKSWTGHFFEGGLPFQWNCCFSICVFMYREDDLSIVIETLAGFKLEGFRRDKTLQLPPKMLKTIPLRGLKAWLRFSRARTEIPWARPVWFCGMRN